MFERNLVLEDIILDETIIEMVDSKGLSQEVSLRTFLSLSHQQELSKDKGLRINRKQIPSRLCLLPDKPQNTEFLRLTNAIKNIAVFDFEPDNENQAIWMRCVQLYWQAKAILLANNIYKLLPNPIQPGGLIHKVLPSQALEEIKLETDADTALYKLLEAGEADLISWAKTKDINYPFNNFEELFIHILKTRFTIQVQGEAFGLKPLWTNRKNARKDYRGWLKFLNNHDMGAEIEAKYIQLLMDMEWAGYPLIVLKSENIHKRFRSFWQSYLRSHRKAVKLIDTRIHWSNVIPYQAKQTNQKLPIQGIINDEGYFDWKWLLKEAIE